MPFDPAHHDSKKITDAHPTLQKAYPTIISRFETLQPGYTLYITCTHRTPEYQFELFKQGRSNHGTTQEALWEVVDPAKIVTNCDGCIKLSHHNRYPAEAIDFVVIDKETKKAKWQSVYYRPLHEICKKLNLVWGGDWTSLQDFPHVQLGTQIASSKHLAGYFITPISNDTFNDYGLDGGNR
jgi:peptidoglycan L-alanyl-D-glutamate endopeptidase CwlK